MARIVPIVEDSILTPNILKARYYFWFVSTLGTLFTLGQSHFTNLNALSALSPLVASLIIWIVNLATIPFFCNGRIKGATGSILAKTRYEKIHQNTKIAAGDLSLCLSNHEVRISMHSAHECRDNTMTFFSPASNQEPETSHDAPAPSTKLL